MNRPNLTLPAFALIILGFIFYSERIVRSPKPPGPVRITYWEKWTGFEGEAMRAVVDEFNRSQNRIFVELLTVSNIRNKTLLAVSGGQPPDIAGLESPDVSQYADANAALPLDDFCREAGIRGEQYIPVYWDMMNYRGRIWALPTTPASTALHYNRRLFREAGLDPDKPPQTIREMEIFIEKMTRREKDGRFVVSGFLPDEPGWWNWGWGYIFGGRLWDEKSQITANCPENIRAFEWIQSFAKRYGTKNLQTFKSGFGTFSSPQNAFLTEKVAMEIQGVWMSNFISQFNPKLDWAASPFPYPDDRPDLKGHTFVDVDVLMIPRGAKHPNEAFEFIRFVQSQRGMELLNLLQRKHTPLIAVSEAFWKKHPNPYIKLFTELPRKGPTFTPPKMALWPEYQAELNSAFDEIMLLKATPKEALDRVQARMQPKLDEYLERIRLREAAGKSHLAGREDLPR